MQTRIRNNCFFFSFYSQHTKAGDKYDIVISINYNVISDKAIIDSNHWDDDFKLAIPNIRMIYVNLAKYKKVWYENVAKDNYGGSLLMLLTER